MPTAPTAPGGRAPGPTSPAPIPRPTANQPPSICTNCASPIVERDYETALCFQCRDRLCNKPFPPWARIGGGMLALVLVASLVKFIYFWDGSVGYARARLAEDSGRTQTAYDRYHRLLERNPEEQDLIERLLIVNIRMGNLEEAQRWNAELRGAGFVPRFVEELDLALDEANLSRQDLWD